MSSLPINPNNGASLSPRRDAATEANSGKASLAVGKLSVEDNDSVELGNRGSGSETYQSQRPAVSNTSDRVTPQTNEREPTQAAANILTFVNARLRADAAEGADEAALTSRLNAGLEGFLKGYQEAYEQLSAMGFLYAEVEEAIEQTFTDVLDGMAALADELGLDAPEIEAVRADQTQRRENFVPSEAVPLESENGNVAVSASYSQASHSQTSYSATSTSATTVLTEQLRQGRTDAENLTNLIEASSFDYRNEEARSFNFSLTTQDGDRLSIRAAFSQQSALDGERISYRAAGEGGADALAVQGQVRVASGFYLDVQGDLDEGELLAIEDLLTQIREVSDLFFSGDVESAFERALELGFNDDEIAAFSLQLRYQSSERYSSRSTQSDVYDGVQKSQNGFANAADNADREKLMILARFVQALEDLRERAGTLGVNTQLFSEPLPAVAADSGLTAPDSNSAVVADETTDAVSPGAGQSSTSRNPGSESQAEPKRPAGIITQILDSLARLQQVA